MSHATAQDMIARVGSQELNQIADRDQNGVFEPEVVQVALDDASALADGYLRARYSLPLPQTPTLLIAIVVDIARYQLHDGAPTESVQSGHRGAMARLNDIAAGRLVLDVGAPQPPTGSQVNVASPPRVFDDGTLKGY